MAKVRRRLGKSLINRIRAQSDIPKDQFDSVLAEAEGEYDLLQMFFEKGLEFVVKFLKQLFESLLNKNAPPATG